MARLGSLYWACTDCVMLIANGEYPPDMTDAETGEWLARIEDLTPPYAHYVIGLPADQHSDECTEVDRAMGCDCGHDAFSMSPCDVCGGNLGGAREAVCTLYP